MENEVKDIRPELEGGDEGSLTVKRNKTVDLIAKIVCLILAFFLWYYASSIDTVIYDEEFTSIPIIIENSSEMALMSGDGMTVEVTVSGNRHNLRKLANSDIRAYVEVPSDITAGKHVLKINYTVPTSVTFEKASASTVEIYVDHRVTKEVQLKGNMFNYQLQGAEYKIGKLPMITVEGPAEIVKTIEYAELPMDLKNETITKTFTYSGEIVLKNSDGETVNNPYVKLSSSTATVTVSVLKERNVPVVVKFKNGLLVPTDCIIAFSRDTIRIKGDADKIKNMVIECVIDEKTLKNGVPVSCGIGLPNDMQNLDEVYNIEVTVTLKGMAEKEFTVTPELKNGTSSSIPPVKVRVRGKADVINSLTASSIKAYVDAEGNEGSLTLPVIFEFEGAFSGKVYEVYSPDSPYEISLKAAPLGR